MVCILNVGGATSTKWIQCISEVICKIYISQGD